MAPFTVPLGFMRTKSATAMPVFQAAGTIVGQLTAATVAWPTHESGDIGLLILETASGEAAGLGTANGFVEIPDSPQDDGVATLLGTRMTVYWCRATSSSMASPVTTDSGNHNIGVIITFRGCVATGDPWDVTAGDVLLIPDTAVTIPGDTTTGDNRLIVAIVSDPEDLSPGTGRYSGFTNADLSDVTERFDDHTGQGNGGGIAVATGGKAVAGAFGATTATRSVSAQSQARIMIALKP